MKNILFRNCKLLILLILTFNVLIIFNVNVFISLAITNIVVLIFSVFFYRLHAKKIYEGFTFLLDVKETFVNRSILLLVWLLSTVFGVFLVSELLRDLGLSFFNAYNTGFLIAVITNYEIERRWLKKHFFTIKDFEV